MNPIGELRELGDVEGPTVTIRCTNFTAFLTRHQLPGIFAKENAN